MEKRKKAVRPRSFSSCQGTRTPDRKKADRFPLYLCTFVPLYLSPTLKGSWASPFTVEAIDGEMASLEMVNELVDIARLEKYD